MCVCTEKVMDALSWREGQEELTSKCMYVLGWPAVIRGRRKARVLTSLHRFVLNILQAHIVCACRCTCCSKDQARCCTCQRMLEGLRVTPRNTLRAIGAARCQDTAVSSAMSHRLAFMREL